MSSCVVQCVPHWHEFIDSQHYIQILMNVKTHIPVWKLTVIMKMATILVVHVIMDTAEEKGQDPKSLAVSTTGIDYDQSRNS